MALAMDQIHHIRMLFYEQQMSISEIARETGRDWKTVRKYVDMDDFNLPEPKPASEKRFCPKLDPWKSTIDQWLLDDKKAPRKQRHTARKIFKDLSKSDNFPGFNCSYRTVAEYVTAKKKELNLENKDKGKLPLIHRPGEAQADFGDALFYENGTAISGKYLVLSFPYSNQGYHQVIYGENMECLLESLDAIFHHIGGVPTEIWFDNASTLVTQIIHSGGRKINERFQRFADHYGFQARFMNPASGWEKGSVENKVGYSRRNFLVPPPRFLSIDDFNQQQLKEADEDADREHYRHDETIRERFESDRDALLPLPAIPLDLRRRIDGITTNGWGKFTLNKGKHEYSVSPKHTNTVVNLLLSSKTVTVLDENYKEIVVHRRLYGDSRQESMEWLPYLGYISRHPRSLRNTGIFDMMPPVMQEYLTQCGNTECGKVLKTLCELTKRTGFDSAVQTVRQAVQYQAHDADSLQNLYRSLYSDVPVLPPLSRDAGIPKIEPIPADLASYDQLLEGGASHERVS